MILGKKKREEEDRAKQQRDLIIKYKKVFGSPEGKEVLFDLINRFHVLNETDPNRNERQDGQRSAVLYILQKCNVNETELTEMLKGE